MKIVKLGTAFLALFALVACGGSGSEEGKDSLPINREQSEEKVQQLAEGDGYYVKFQYSSSDNGEEEEPEKMYYGVKDGVVWAGDDEGSGAAIKKDGNQYHYYYLEEGAYVYGSTVSGEQADSYEASYQAIYSNWLYFGNAYDGQLKKGADTTVAGRSCYTYTFNFSSARDLGAYTSLLSGVADVKVEYKIAVDKELGLTMKLELTGEADGDKGSFNFEVLEFKTGSQVQVPTLPAPTPDAD